MSDHFRAQFHRIGKSDFYVSRPCTILLYAYYTVVLSARLCVKQALLGLHNISNSSIVTNVTVAVCCRDKPLQMDYTLLVFHLLDAGCLLFGKYLGCLITEH